MTDYTLKTLNARLAAALARRDAELAALPDIPGNERVLQQMAEIIVGNYAPNIGKLVGLCLVAEWHESQPLNRAAPEMRALLEHIVDYLQLNVDASHIRARNLLNRLKGETE